MHMQHAVVYPCGVEPDVINSATCTHTAVGTQHDLLEVGVWGVCEEGGCVAHPT